MVTCSYTSDNTETNVYVMWKKDGTAFTSEQNGRVTTERSTKMSKYQMVRAGKSDMGEYSCDIIKTKGGANSTTTIAGKKVYVRGIEMSSAMADEDYKTASLNCSFFGDQVTSITWTSPALTTVTSDYVHDLSSISYSNYVSKSMLSLKALNSSSLYGTYMCKAYWTTNPVTLTQTPHLSRK